jgi:subtilase family serine protease
VNSRFRVTRAVVLVSTVAVAAALSLPLTASATSHGSTDAAKPNIVPAGCNHIALHQSVKPMTASCFALINKSATAALRHDVATGVQPQGISGGVTAAMLEKAYNLTSLVGSSGSGQLIATVDAGGYPSAASDLAQYRSIMGLPACTTGSGCLSILNERGQTSPLPPSEGEWQLEAALDLDMISAACPLCHILIVETDSQSGADLGKGVNTAVSKGADAVSNSYGWGDTDPSQGEPAADYQHANSFITVSTGDSGYETGGEASFPATLNTVTAVGGTTLSTASGTRGYSESAWSDAGSSCTTHSGANYKAPAWQPKSMTTCKKRAIADVSADADPNSGAQIYCSPYGGLLVVGGTSESSPFVAGVVGLAGNGSSLSHQAPYQHTSSLYDVTTGSNGSCGVPICTARAGWDGPTGLGSPNGDGAF